MTPCPLYNGKNLDFTGNKNPYSLIQNGGKRKLRRPKNTMRKKCKYCKSRVRKTRKHKVSFRQ